MIPQSPLEDPDNASYAWDRYKRLMWFMLVLAIGVVGLAIWYLHDGESMVSVHYYIAIALGISFTMLLTGALMGLVFLSSGTGHDESVTDLMDDDSWDDKNDSRD